MKIVVVVPSYNERENIGPMIEALEARFPSIPHEMHVLVVDDNSPDGTADVVRDAATRWPNVHLLSGEKRGLGVAYVRGIRHALDELGADAVMQMDADFSHDPEDVPRLVAALDQGADFVIGSRYVKGGKAPADWGLVRRGISFIANTGARIIAGFYSVHDCTNGFRAIRGDLLRRIDLDRAPRGYVVLMYLIYQALSHGARVAEVPVVFSNRTRGESKLSVSDAFEFFVNAWWIRYDRRETFYRLASGGLSGVAANLGALVLLHLVLGVPAAVASALALEIAVLYSFVWRRAWTVVSGRPLGTAWPLRLLLYHAVSVPSFALTFGTFLLLTLAWDVHFLVAQTLGILPALFWNYFLGERVLERLWERLRVHLRGFGSSLDRLPQETFVTQHTPTSSHDILEQVPPDYYEAGIRRNLFQRLWHGRKWSMLHELLSKDPSFQPSRVLDVGCAGGLTTSKVAEWYPAARVTGLDAFDEAVVYASKRHQTVNFVLADGHELPFAGERFDLITCVETLEHLGDPRRAVSEMHRCLRPGGVAVVAQDTDSLLFRSVWWVWTKSRGQVWDHAHVNPLDAKQLKALLQDVGFRVLETRYTFFGMEVFYKLQRTG